MSEYSGLVESDSSITYKYPAFVLLAFVLAASPAAYSQLVGGSGAISGYHGNPSVCTDCHFAAAYTAGATITAPTSVVHGANSTAFTLNGTGGIARGFNIAIYNPSNTKVVGGFTNLSAGIYSGQAAGELQHEVAETRTSWNFRWNAPATLGTYTVYACVNPVNNNGTDVGDGNAACDTDTFIVTNNNPNAVNDSKLNLAVLAVGENSTTGTFNVLSNDLQTESDAFEVNAINTTGITGILTTVGALSNGNFSFDPNNLYESLDSGETDTTTFTYTIRETSYLTYTDTATVTVEIQGANDAPIATNDGASGFGNGFASVIEGGVLAGATVLGNDSDIDVETLTATQTGCSPAATGPTNSASFTLNTDGTFSYTHDGSNTTADNFSYCADDGTVKSNTVVVYIDITAVNDPPTISGFDGSIAYTEQASITLDNSVTIADSDSSNINDAQLQISAGFESGVDSMACALPLPSGVTGCSFAGDTLTISGNTALANYQTAINAVSFSSSSENPALAAKTISLSLRDGALSPSLVSTKTISPITRTNDAPTIAAINPPTIDADSNHAYENTGNDPYTFSVTAVASDVDVDDDTNSGDGSLIYSLVGEPAGMTISNSSPTQGQISWAPAQTGVFGRVYGPVTVQIEDGDEDTSAPNSVDFSMTVSPPDDDSDSIANYNDLCLSISDPTNADNDFDGTAGTDGGVNSGGDVCDLDDDNDGMPDSFEIANGFDSFSSSDASTDADGDGISNLDEYLAGTNPNFADLVIDATGYWTPYDIVPPLPASINAAATGVRADDYGPYRPGLNSITWTAFNSSNSNLGSSIQSLSIRPLLNFSVDQLAEEGDTVTVLANLNGPAVSYPVTVNYAVSGSATVSDHNAVNGSLIINSPDQNASFTFDISSDAISEPAETVVFDISSATNAAIGSRDQQTVTIVEDNITPGVELVLSQAGNPLSSVYVSEGLVSVNAIVDDVNSAQTHSFDWSTSDNSLMPPIDSTTSLWSFTPTVGVYLLEVTVTDSGSPARSNRISRVLNIENTAPLLTTANSDGEGANDSTEGFDDSDGDGVPDYLDANDGAAGQANLLPNQTVALSTQFLLETEPGLTLSLGKTAMTAKHSGVLVTDSDIENFGSESGTAPLNAIDSYDHIGGAYDFEVKSLIAGASASVVIPLETAIPADAVYRKFHPLTGWRDFVIDGNNRVESARGERGACPEPGSSLYRAGLNYLDNCLQLTIEDGGANDIDGIANGVIRDPGSIGVALSEPATPGVKGGGLFHPLMLFGFWLLILWQRSFLDAKKLQREF